MNGKMSLRGFVLILLILLAGACGPGATPRALQPTFVLQSTSTSRPRTPTRILTPTNTPTRTPTRIPTPTPTPIPLPPAAVEIEADLWNYTRVRAEAEETLDPELLRQVCVDSYLTSKIGRIEKNKQGGSHWETRGVTFTITALELESEEQAKVYVTKTETKLFFPPDSALPDDETCGAAVYSYRSCTYQVLYTMIRREGHWYVADAVDDGDCQGVCQIAAEPPIGALREASFAGVTFSYDTALVSKVYYEFLPPDMPDNDTWGQPQHYQFSFRDGALPERSRHCWYGWLEPTIRIFPVAEYEAMSEYVRSQIDRLRQLLVDRPTTIPAAMNYLPYGGGGMIMPVQVAYLDFQNGAGVRLVGAYGGQDWESVHVSAAETCDF